MAGGRKSRSRSNKQSTIGRRRLVVVTSPTATSAPEQQSWSSTPAMATSSARSAAILPAAIMAMTKEQLKSECRKLGRKTGGNKSELLQRLGCNVKGGGAVKNNNNNNSALMKAHKGAETSNGFTTASNLGGAGENNGKKNGRGGGDRMKRERDRQERESLVLWRRPWMTVDYATREIGTLLAIYSNKILQYRKLVTLISILVVSTYLFLSSTTGREHHFVQSVYKKLLWCSYWIGLGILSSVGLGTGLHTFLLYLGPHIAAVTMAAYECSSLSFPEPPYPDEIICPDDPGTSTSVTILSIMAKVRLEAMCWGAGTALGELPPYFMARAARLSGLDPDDDDDLKEFEELQAKKQKGGTTQLTLIERGKIFVEDLVQKVGFLGILACASIPNPLFDLAGITCGHFLVPFWTFFGATLIGKAVIKMHVQKLFVIVAFDETLIQMALDWLSIVPFVGQWLQVPVRAFLDGQKTRLHHHGSGSAHGGGGGLIGSIFEKFVMAMIVYFLVSIVDSFAQSHHKRLSHGNEGGGKRGGRSKAKVAVD